MRLLVPLVALLFALTACSNAPDGSVRWRGMEVDIPAGWQVNENDRQKLSLADAPFAEESAEELTAAIFITHEPGTGPDDWRAFVEEQGGTLETDQKLTLDGSPATKLVFSYDANGTPLREMVVVVPARETVMLFQPVVLREGDGIAAFEEHRSAFEEVLSSVTFGAPVATGG